MFPVQRGKTGFFEMTETTLDTIKKNIMMFIAVDEGERVVNNQLGSRFRRFLFENDIENIKFKCENEINRIFNSFFSNLNLERFQVNIEEDTQTTKGLLKLQIEYSIKGLESVKDSLAVIIG